TLTITGVTNDNVNIAFTDATHFFVSINGVSTNYSTDVATKIIYNGPSGFSSVVYTDIFNPYTATQSFTSTKVTENGFEFDANDVHILYIYVTNSASTATVSVAAGTVNTFYVCATTG